MRQAFNCTVYDTDTATLIARNKPPDTINYLKGHRNRYLYRSPEGAYFLYLLNESYFGVVGDSDPEILPLTEEQAMAEYENLEDQLADIKERARRVSGASKGKGANSGTDDVAVPFTYYSQGR